MLRLRSSEIFEKLKSLYSRETSKKTRVHPVRHELSMSCIQILEVKFILFTFVVEVFGYFRVKGANMTFVPV